MTTPLPPASSGSPHEPPHGPQPPPSPAPSSAPTAAQAAAPADGAPAPLRYALPFRRLWPVLGGAAVGLALRGLFSADPGERYTAMAAAFVLFAPVAVGAVTVYLAERQRPRSLSYYLLAPLWANTLMVFGSMLALWEGLICSILVLPVFAVAGAIGGLLMGLVCRLAWRREPTVYGLAALPLVLAAFGVGQDAPPRLEHVQRSVIVQAPPAQVWAHLLDADRIRPDEVERAWMYRIGVPKPLAGLTHRDSAGRLVREVRMGKGIAFRQESDDWQAQRYVRWRYRFGPDSVPSRALDDHVRIGGHYFDLRETTYTLTPHGQGSLLSIRMDYRVSTGFNWYAAPLAAWLIGDFSQVILEFYRERAQAPAAPTA